MMIHKAVVISVSLLMLPSLSEAQYSSAESADHRAAKTQITRSGNMDKAMNPVANTGASRARNEVVTTSNSNNSRNNKRRAERQFPRFEPADPRDTVLSSEICVYSSATYTYTCR